ncbi:MAG: CoA transferase [Actinomycetia bacterium]|nr:CoA transferase [Actinomycetes bacterium]MCP5035241.1 CoA transferase [Actinomycetes bacterium]
MCDFTGQLAGAGATRWLSVFGAQIIRIEDPVLEGRWDILRGSPPFKDERRGVEFGSGFNNHNVEKLGVTLNLRTERGRDLVRELVSISDAVADNFASGVMERLGLGFDELCRIREDIIYVSNCGFGQTGPYRDFKSWGPIAQAVSGLTHSSGLVGQEPAGWGYSYMDHTGGYYGAIALLMALWHREQTGEGQWVDLSCTEAGGNLHGADLLDWSVNGRALRSDDRPASNRSSSPDMAPHGVYPCRGDDNWVAIACRDDADWMVLRAAVGSPLLADSSLDELSGRMAAQDTLDEVLASWTRGQDRWSVASQLQDQGVPASPVTRPAERIDGDLATSSWGLWPMVHHEAMGGVRVDGEPVHFSVTDWEIENGAPILGQHNHYVFGELLGLSEPEIEDLADEGVI